MATLLLLCDPSTSNRTPNLPKPVLQIIGIELFHRQSSIRDHNSIILYSTTLTNNPRPFPGNYLPLIQL